MSAVGLNPRSGSVSQRLNEIPIVGAMRESRSASQDPNSGFLDKVAAGPGALVGMSDESARGHAARGESGAIVGEAVAPTAMALSPLAADGVAKGLGATKGYVGKGIVDLQTHIMVRSCTSRNIISSATVADPLMAQMLAF